MFLHDTEVVETTDEQATTVCPQIEIYIFTEIPVQIILHILGQVYVEQNKVTHVTPGEWSLCLLGIQLAVPLLNAQYCIMNNFGGGFNVLENILQRHVLTGAPRLQGLAGLLVGTVHVPQHAGVIHDHNERPHALALDSQFLQAVSLQLQIVVRKLLNEKSGSTNASVVEHAWQDEHDVVGPVLAVQWHFVLFDYEEVKVTDAFHGMVEVQEAVLMTSTGWSEDRTLDCIQILVRNERETHAF